MEDRFRDFVWQCVDDLLDKPGVWDTVELLAQKLFADETIKFTALYEALKSRHEPMFSWPSAKS